MGRKPHGKKTATSTERVAKHQAKKREEKALVAMEGEMKDFNVFKQQKEARDFVSRLVEADGNLVLAVRHTFPGYATALTEVCYKKGKKLLEKLEVATILRKAMDSMEVSVDGIVADIVSISKSAEKDADKLRALELLGKFKKMFDMDTGQKILNINVGEDEFRRLAERRFKGRDIIDAGREDGSSSMCKEVIDGLRDTNTEELHT